MKLAAQELTPFLDMIGRHSAAHPALARLIEAGPYYSDAAFDVTLTAGNKEGNAPFTFGVIGTANGGKIAASYQAPDLAQALAGQGMLLEATLENPQTSVLLGQAGLDPAALRSGRKRHSCHKAAEHGRLEGQWLADLHHRADVACGERCLRSCARALSRRAGEAHAEIRGPGALSAVAGHRAAPNGQRFAGDGLG